MTATLLKLTYPLTPAGVFSALTALGDTPDAVYDTLLAGGHRGTRSCSGRCPVASYLQSLYPGHLVAVDCLRSTVGPVEMLHNPVPVAAFVALFDTDRCYLDLEAWE